MSYRHEWRLSYCSSLNLRTRGFRYICFCFKLVVLSTGMESRTSGKNEQTLSKNTLGTTAAQKTDASIISEWVKLPGLEFFSSWFSEKELKGRQCNHTINCNCVIAHTHWSFWYSKATVALMEIRNKTDEWWKIYLNILNKNRFFNSVKILSLISLEHFEIWRR